MKKEQDQTIPPNSQVADQIAKNPNPRTNENIRDRSEKLDTETVDIEDDVGSEITDGEDA